ncbi:MAG: dynamin family protein [Anaerolineales bacterium]
MRQSLLTDEQASFLREEKEALAEIQVALSNVRVPPEGLLSLQQSILQLDELFLLVVVGEFNAGKSALINALLGSQVLPEGATPTTSKVTLLKWGEQVAERIVDEGYAVRNHPLPLLKELNIVDTPGTNAVIRHHERLTDEFVPRSDLVLLVTSADRPMSESERQFLERILAWGKKVVFVLNKADIFDDEPSLQEVRDFVLKHATMVLGDTPEIFQVSARLAQRAASEPDPEERARLRAASRLDELERYITNTLDDATRLELKLSNPLGTAENLVRQAQTAANVETENLKEDIETAAALAAVVGDYASELHSELEPRLAAIENILHRLEQRGLDFFDSTMRLTNIAGLARGAEVRAKFETQVLADVPEQIDDQVQRLIDWLVQKDLHQWQQVMTYLQRRQADYVDHIVGEAGGPSDTRRRELIDTVGKTAQTIVESYDRNQEARELAAAVETAVAQTALLEAGAVGLGALITIAVVSSTVDITGLLAAGSMAILGFFVIPYKRNQAKENFKEKMATLRTKLVGAMTTQFESEAERAIDRLKEGVTPYTRFIKAEQQRLEEATSTLAALQQRVAALKARSHAVARQGRRS